MPKIISIEGNIGAGKTTILEKLQQYMEGDATVAFLREPVDIWQTFCDRTTGENILQKFYKDPSKYAFSFQIMACATRMSTLRKIISDNPNCSVIICERSIDVDKHVFAKMLHDDGLIEDVHMQIYEHFYQEFVKEFQLDGLVFINAAPNVCFDRIEQRGREGESKIAIEYLEKCDKYHRDWVDSLDPLKPTLNIDANECATYNLNDHSDMGQIWLHQINMLIKKLQMDIDLKEAIYDSVWINRGENWFTGEPSSFA